MGILLRATSEEGEVEEEPGEQAALGLLKDAKAGQLELATWEERLKGMMVDGKAGVAALQVNVCCAWKWCAYVGCVLPYATI